MIKSLGFLIVLILVSCASEKPTGKTEAEILYKEAMSLSKDERYLLATEKLNSLKNQYPYSFYATPAELLQAEIYFNQESYIESAEAFLLFKELHPKHEKISYVMYMIAESYFRQIPDTYDRDLEAAIEAKSYYEELTRLFPTSEQSKEAKTKIAKVAKMLRDKEQYVADFYFKTEVYAAAKWRYLDILENFQDIKLRSHSMKRIISSSYFLKEFENCVEYAKKFERVILDSDKNSVLETKEKCKKKVR